MSAGRRHRDDRCARPTGAMPTRPRSCPGGSATRHCVLVVQYCPDTGGAVRHLRLVVPAVVDDIEALADAREHRAQSCLHAGLRHAVLDVDVLVGLPAVLDSAERLGVGREGQRQEAGDDECKDRPQPTGVAKGGCEVRLAGLDALRSRGCHLECSLLGEALDPASSTRLRGRSQSGSLDMQPKPAVWSRAATCKAAAVPAATLRWQCPGGRARIRAS